MHGLIECIAQIAGNRSTIRSGVVSETHHQAIINEIVSHIVVQVKM